jgi:hypothetical protein
MFRLSVILIFIDVYNANIQYYVNIFYSCEAVDQVLDLRDLCFAWVHFTVILITADSSDIFKRQDKAFC